jgi:long-chain acyl-CoA synthetase
VEEVLATHPNVSLSAVIGKPDEKYGEEVMAFVIPKDGADLKPDDLIAWSKAELSNYKYPRIVKVVDELPLGATGKVLKTELRKQIGD